MTTNNTLTSLAHAMAISQFISEWSPMMGPEQFKGYQEFMETKFNELAADLNATPQEIDAARESADDWLRMARRKVSEIN
jgi:hypothetical protein